MADVRVRFAPSPTGALHLGGVRTALFNWLFARKHKGTFILRIEDTDRTRSTDDAIQVIIDGLQWLGLDVDEGPFRQTDRLALYREAVERLLSGDHAYRCYCSPEELEAQRAEAKQRGLPPRYDGRCRSRTAPMPGRQPVIRFKAPQAGQIVVNDLIKGHVVFENAQLDDLILMRSDGMPTYNLCVVVDDLGMRITHIIRGDDHLNNTPKQFHLYRALGQTPPAVAHLPMILGSDRGRLSKRHGSTSVLDYRAQGYLPEALINYLARLGWAHGDQEIFSLPDLMAKFDLAEVGASSAAFDPEKLLWLNGLYMRHAAPRRVAELARPFLLAEGLIRDGEGPNAQPAGPWPWFERAIQTLQSRSKTLVELVQGAAYLFREPELDPKAQAKHLTVKTRPLLDRLVAELDQIETFNEPSLKAAFERVTTERGVSLGDLAQPVRVALTGKTVSAGIFEVLELLGKPRSIARLRRALATIPSPPVSSPFEGEE